MTLALHAAQDAVILQDRSDASVAARAIDGAIAELDAPADEPDWS